MNSHYASIFSNPPTNCPTNSNGLPTHSSSLNVFTESEISKLIKNLPCRSAAGPDGICTQLLRLAPDIFASYLNVIFKHSLTRGTLPDDWKAAIVVPIHKSGDKSKPINYRPVSLTSICCKLMERILDNYIRDFLESKNIILKTQHGFRRGFSCQTQLAVFSQDLSDVIEAGGQIDALLLDFSKAFDLVPHHHLLDKLTRLQVDPQLILWIHSFLSGRTQRVRVDEALSDSVPVTSGVPQGSVMGPLLFLIYINDIACGLSSNIRLFADDCILYRVINNNTDCESLQTDFNKLCNWCHEWQMILNHSKCFKISFTTKRRPFTAQYLFPDGNYVQTTDNSKYLGVHFSSNVSWGHHIEFVVNKAFRALYYLKRNYSKAPANIKSLLYSMLVRSVLEYGCVVWDPHQVNHINALERVQRAAARFVTNSYSWRISVTDLLQRLGWNSLAERRKTQRITSFYNVYTGTGGWEEMSSRLLRPTYFSRHDHPFKTRTRFARKGISFNSFISKTARDWNSLPATLFNNGLPSLNQLKQHLKTA
jgi:hypothetical protein